MSSSAPEAEIFRLLQAGKLAEAEAAGRAILARKPGDAQALHLLGLVLAQSGRREEGLALLDRSIVGAMRNAAFLNNRARVLVDLGRMEGAERDLRKALGIDPSFYAAYCQLGGVLRVMGRLEEAMAAFRRAQAIEPGGADARVGLGNVLRDSGERRSAVPLRPGCGVARPARVVARRPAQLDGPQHVRAEVLHRLEGADRHAELLSLLGVLDGVLQQPAGGAQHLG